MESICFESIRKGFNSLVILLNLQINFLRLQEILLNILTKYSSLKQRGGNSFRPGTLTYHSGNVGECPGLKQNKTWQRLVLDKMLKTLFLSPEK